MAFNNAFQVTQLFSKGTLMDYASSLRTAMLAKPYMKFDHNATLGTTINEGYPYRYNVVGGLTYDPATQINSTTDKTQAITLGATSIYGTQTSATVPFGLSAQEMSFSSKASTLEEFRNYYLGQTGMQIADYINQATIDMCEGYWCDVVGDPTSGLNGFNTLMAVNAQVANMELMGRNGKDQIYLGLHPDAYTQLQIPYATYFNEEVNKPLLKTGRTAYQAGLNLYEDNLIRKHQNGSFATTGTIQVAATVAQGTLNATQQTITLKGFTASQTGVLLAGDIIYFGTTGNYVYRLLPIGKQASSQPKGFVVLANVNSDGAGNATVLVRNIPIFNDGSPMPNQYRNISRQIVTNDVVTLFAGGSTVWTKNLVFDRNGFFFANPPIATYPLQPSSAANKMSAYPNEVVETLTVPGTQGMRLSMNVSNLGDLSQFSNTFAARTISGVLPFENYGFILASKA